MPAASASRSLPGTLLLLSAVVLAFGSTLASAQCTYNCTTWSDIDSALNNGASGLVVCIDNDIVQTSASVVAFGKTVTIQANPSLGPNALVTITANPAVNSHFLTLWGAFGQNTNIYVKNIIIEKFSYIQPAVRYNANGSYGKLFLTNLIFRFNTLTTTSIYPGGGALWADGEVVFNNVSFISNVAAGNGGAVYGNQLDFTNCYFYNNTVLAGGRGGAVAGGLISAKTTRFVQNGHISNVLEGGAIYGVDTQFFISSTTFDGNSAVKGGAVFFSSTVTYRNVLFDQGTVFNNNSASMGAAVYLTTSASGVYPATFVNCAFGSGNTCSGSFCSMLDVYPLNRVNVALSHCSFAPGTSINSIGMQYSPTTTFVSLVMFDTCVASYYDGTSSTSGIADYGLDSATFCSSGCSSIDSLCSRACPPISPALTCPTCAIGFRLKSTCVLQCPNGFYSDADNQLCLSASQCTAKGYFLDDATTACVASCPTDKYVHAVTKTCVTVPLCLLNGDYIMESTKMCYPYASCVNAGFAVDNSTNSCVAACPTNNYIQTSTRYCVSSSQCVGYGWFMDDTTKLCSPICNNSATVRDTASSRCVLPSACPTNQYADLSTGSCTATCSSGKYGLLSTKTCVTAAVCGANGLFGDSVSGTCVVSTSCPTNTLGGALTYTCVSQTTCLSNSLFIDTTLRVCNTTCTNSSTVKNTITGFCVAPLGCSSGRVADFVTTRSCITTSACTSGGMLIDKSLNTCVASCSAPAVYFDASTKICYSVADCAAAGLLVNSVNQTCTSVCATNFYKQTSTSECVLTCASGSVADPFTMLCGTTCTGGYVPLFDSRMCVLPSTTSSTPVVSSATLVSSPASSPASSSASSPSSSSASSSASSSSPATFAAAGSSSASSGQATTSAPANASPSSTPSSAVSASPLSSAPSSSGPSSTPSAPAPSSAASSATASATAGGTGAPMGGAEPSASSGIGVGVGVGVGAGLVVLVAVLVLVLRRKGSRRGAKPMSGLSLGSESARSSLGSTPITFLASRDEKHAPKGVDSSFVEVSIDKPKPIEYLNELRKPAVTNSYESTIDPPAPIVAVVPAASYDNELPSYVEISMDDAALRQSLAFVKKLGEGEFGEVQLATIPTKYIADSAPDLIPLTKKNSASDTTTFVAVKLLKSNADEKSQRDFASEMNMMKHFRHPSIVRVLAALFEEEPFMLVLEFLPYSDLRSVLLKSVSASIPWTEPECIHALQQIAQGLAYLASLRFVHRDLAARNCLVGADLTVKISDFGLSRELIDENDYYRVQTKGKLPVKWMAPESINYRKFTSASDVWSFGIVCWEVFSYGAVPYANMATNELTLHLDQGLRLDKPEQCSETLYNFMAKCWDKNPAVRPTPDQCASFLGVIAPANAPIRDLGKMVEHVELIYAKKQ